jgi:hypothetical protein
MKQRITTLFAVAFLLPVLTLMACSDEPDEEATPTTGAQPPATSTDVPEATATSTTGPAGTPEPAAGAPDAPSDVTLEGPLPDLQTPVPPGEGELGRLTIAWQDNSNNETGFRVYQECDGAETVLMEVPAGETSYGPLQTCRPGRLGVAAFNADGESEIVWVS